MRKQWSNAFKILKENDFELRSMYSAKLWPTRIKIFLDMQGLKIFTSLVPFIKNYWKEFPGGPVVRTLLSLPRAWVRSLLGELRSCKPCGTAKKKKAIGG